MFYKVDNQLIADTDLIEVARDYGYEGSEIDAAIAVLKLNRFKVEEYTPTPLSEFD